MNTAIIVMTLLGCGQTDAACDYIRTVDAQFASRAECEARMDAELLKTGSAGYPNVIAVCEPSSEPGGTVADLPAPGNAVVAETGEPKVIMAPPEAEPKRPLKRLVRKTREAASRFGEKLGSAWKKIVHSGSRREEPVVLGRFASSEN